MTNNHPQAPMFSKPLVSLTPKEILILQFLEVYIEQKGYSPTYTEIKNYFGFASYNSVQRYLKQLHKKGYIYTPGGNQKRAVQILHSFPPKENSSSSIAPPPSETYSIPLLGSVAAGSPIERLSYDEHLEVPPSLLKNPQKSFALKVVGQSMMNNGILDGDVILVQKQESAQNGNTVVATVNNEATVKNFYTHSANDHSNIDGPCVELRPANDNMTSFWYKPQDVKINGIVVGLLRQF